MSTKLNAVSNWKQLRVESNAKRILEKYDGWEIDISSQPSYFSKILFTFGSTLYCLQFDTTLSLVQLGTQ